MQTGIKLSILAFFLLGADIISTCIGCGGTMGNYGPNIYHEQREYREISANCSWTFVVSEAEVLYLKLEHLKIYYFDGKGEKHCGDSYIKLAINGQSVNCKKSITQATGATCYAFYRTRNCRNVASSLYPCSSNHANSSGSSMEVRYVRGLNPPGVKPDKRTGLRFKYKYIPCPAAGFAETSSTTTMLTSSTPPTATTKSTTTTTIISTSLTTTTTTKSTGARRTPTISTSSPTTTTATKSTRAIRTPTISTSSPTTTTATKSTRARRTPTISTSSPTTTTATKSTRARPTPTISTSNPTTTTATKSTRARPTPTISTSSPTTTTATKSTRGRPTTTISTSPTTTTTTTESTSTAPTTTTSTRFSTTAIIMIAVGAFLLFLAIGTIVFCIRRRRRIRNGHMQQSVSLHEYGFQNAYAEATGSAELKENVLYGGVDHETVETAAVPVVNAAVNEVASEGATVPVMYAAVNKAASETATVPAVYAEVNKVAHGAATVPDVYAEVNKVASGADQAYINNNGQRTQAFSTFKCD